MHRTRWACSADRRPNWTEPSRRLKRQVIRRSIWRSTRAASRARSQSGTMHLAKGLEFRAVVVVACDDEVAAVAGKNRESRRVRPNSTRSTPPSATCSTWPAPAPATISWLPASNRPPSSSTTCSPSHRQHRHQETRAPQRHLPPLDRRASGRIAVKVINHVGDEVMKSNEGLPRLSQAVRQYD